MTIPQPETLCCVICNHIEQPGESHRVVYVEGEEWDECPNCGHVDTGGNPSYLRYEVMPWFEKIGLLEAIISEY